ncbi:MAG: TIM barrel protein [Euryarchaeota archaeon]|nr:TIM barrel protein [Euryarchaeota archaeon]
MMRFGPAGIPLSCKGRTLRDGIEDVHTLGLNALEIQLVRANVFERMASEDESGLTPRQIRDEMVIEFVRASGKKEQRLYIDDKIKAGDTLRVMAPGIAKDWEHLNYLGMLAKNLDVQLSIHAPYYIDMTSDDDVTARSVEAVKWCGILAGEMAGVMSVTHLGLYGNVAPQAAMKRIERNLKGIRDWYKRQELKVPLGIETSGRQEVAGSLEEVIAVCKGIKGLVPVLNFAHVHARGNGSLKTKEDFQAAFDSCAKFVPKGTFYTHFSGVEHEGGNENRYTPIKKGDLRFDPLSECILDNKFDITIVSDSPLLEHDAMYMKVIMERILARRELKFQKEKKAAKGKK